MCRKLIQSKFYGAAVSIQSKFRGYRARKHVTMLRRLVAIQKRQALAAKRIQNRVRLSVFGTQLGSGYYVVFLCGLLVFLQWV